MFLLSEGGWFTLRPARRTRLYTKGGLGMARPHPGMVSSPIVIVPPYYSRVYLKSGVTVSSRCLPCPPLPVTGSPVTHTAAGQSGWGMVEELTGGELTSIAASELRRGSVTHLKLVTQGLRHHHGDARSYCTRVPQIRDD